MLEARRFLLNLRPPIVDEMRSITLQWGIFWRVHRDRPLLNPNNTGKLTKDYRLYLDLWQRAASLPKLRELDLWVYWGPSLDDLGSIACIKYVDGKIVEGPERLLDFFNLTQPISPPLILE